MKNRLAQDKNQAEIDTLKKQLVSLKELRLTGFSNVTKEYIAKLDQKSMKKRFIRVDWFKMLKFKV